MRAAVLAGLAPALTGLGPRAVTAQTSEVRVEVGASRILPPEGVDGEEAAFAVAGLRASSYRASGTGGYGFVLLGRALDATAGSDFVSAELGGTASLGLLRGWAAEVEGRASGFQIAAPFDYQVAAAEAGVALRYRGGPITARLAGGGGLGRSRMTISSVVQRMRRQAQVRQVLVDDLWRYGATLEVLAGTPTLAGGVAAGAHESAGGAFRSAGARMVAAGRRGMLELRVDTWRTPAGNRNTGTVSFWVPWGPWSARGVAGRPEPDPLLLAEPGREAGGMLIGRRIHGGTSAPDRKPLHEMVARTPRGARIRFVLDGPRDARTVELIGDFTLWKPEAMAAGGGHWSLELEVAPGTYHFGFLVDGVWYLPGNAADAVPDEWGRRSATLVIEGEAES